MPASRFGTDCPAADGPVPRGATRIMHRHVRLPVIALRVPPFPHADHGKAPVTRTPPVSLPLLAALADERDAARGASRFHATLVAALAEWVLSVTPTGGTVVGAGGCMLNQVLARGLRARFAARGLRLLEAREIPPNDGGLALGQAFVALHPLTEP